MFILDFYNVVYIICTTDCMFILDFYNVVSRAYEEKRACNSQCKLRMHQIIDESAGYAILFSQPRTKEIGVNTVILANYCKEY